MAEGGGGTRSRRFPSKGGSGAEGEGGVAALGVQVMGCGDGGLRVRCGEGSSLVSVLESWGRRRSQFWWLLGGFYGGFFVIEGVPLVPPMITGARSRPMHSRSLGGSVLALCGLSASLLLLCRCSVLPDLCPMKHCAPA